MKNTTQNAANLENKLDSLLADAKRKNTLKEKAPIQNEAILIEDPEEEDGEECSGNCNCNCNDK